MRRYLPRIAMCAAVLLAAASIAMSFGTQPVSAVDLFPNTNPDDVCTGPGGDSAVCSGDGYNNISGPRGVILQAVSIITVIAGIAAVILIMIAGFIFITAGGDSGKVSTAKNTVTYAVVGLVVIFLARGIVVFIINNVIE